MPVSRPEILTFEGKTAAAAYQEAETEFQRRYGAGPIVDALGHVVTFPAEACHHVCFKSDDEEGGRRAMRTQWRPHRAAHIPWIATVLRDPWEIRPNKVSGRLSYFLQFSSDPAAGYPTEAMYFAVTEPSRDPRKATFVTAFPVLNRRYWNEARQVGRCLYPPEKVKSKTRGK